MPSTSNGAYEAPDHRPTEQKKLGQRGFDLLPVADPGPDLGSWFCLECVGDSVEVTVTQQRDDGDAVTAAIPLAVGQQLYNARFSSVAVTGEGLIIAYRN